jgi:hypothetical protein
MKLFEQAFNQQLKEDMTSAHVLGSSPEMASVGPYEIEYAGGRDGDNRLPMGGKKKQKKHKKKPKDGSLQTLIPTQRRPFNTQM